MSDKYTDTDATAYSGDGYAATYRYGDPDSDANEYAHATSHGYADRDAAAYGYIIADRGSDSNEYEHATSYQHEYTVAHSDAH